MKNVKLTDKEHKRLVSCIESKLTALPVLLKERKERYNGSVKNLSTWVSFGSKIDKENFEHNKRMIATIEKNIKLYKSILTKLK